MTSWLRELRFKHRHMKACRKLARMTEERASSFEIQDYRRRRLAALKGRGK